ncbi:MAG: alanine:cation symporter family protein [Evtepia sp.]
MTPFQAMSTALAGTVGTGNIAGITTAITAGRPWYHAVAVDHRPDRHGDQVFRGPAGRQVP